MRQKEKKSFFDFNIMLLMFALIPLITGTVILAVYNIINLDKKLEEDTYSRLKACAVQTQKYFETDIKKGKLKLNDDAEDFIDSLKEQEIELTLFEGDTRWLTSVLKADGSRNNGTTCDAKIWEQVKSGKSYQADKVMINNEEYYVYYTPVYGDDNKVWGMAFAGEKERYIKEAKSSVLITTLIIAFTIVAIFVVVALLFARVVINPLIKVTKAMQDTAKGDLNVDTNIHSITDETIKLVEAAQTLKDVLGKTINRTKEISQQVSLESEEVASLSATSASGTSQIVSAMEDLSNGAVAMAENVQNINKQVLDMDEAIEKITNNTNALVESSNTISTANEEAGSYMKKVSESSEHSVEAIDNINRQISETNEAIEDVKDAVELIISIASQTNLLSLNASIEAARAGEAGKGFAVVAGEIKTLAEQSNESAEKIKGIVNNIVDKSSRSVALSKEVAGIIEEEQKYIADTQKKFQVLAKEIDVSLQQIDSISTLTDALITTKETINNAVSELSAISEENAASNEEVTASIHDISNSVGQIAENSQGTKQLTVELNETIAYFN